MDGHPRPQSELLLAEVKSMPQNGEEIQGRGVEDEHRAHGHGDLAFTDGQDRPHGRNGGPAADGRARGNECRGAAGEAQHPPQPVAQHQGRDDGGCGEHCPTGARPQDRGQVHAESEHHNAGLQEPLGQPMPSGTQRIPQRQCEHNTAGQGHAGRGKHAQPRGRYDESDDFPVRRESQLRLVGCGDRSGLSAPA